MSEQSIEAQAFDQAKAEANLTLAQELASELGVQNFDSWLATRVETRFPGSTVYVALGRELTDGADAEDLFALFIVKEDGTRIGFSALPQTKGGEIRRVTD